MRIIQLTAENVKRLHAIDITPDAHIQVISGRNAQGKTSVMDAMWLALGGGAASRDTSRPVRDGEDQASVTVDLGDLKVTRTWEDGKTKLTVTDASGARQASPQSLLDRLVGRLSFDPLAFTRLDARAQVKALTEVVDLDVDLNDIAAERQRVFDQRTEAGRDLKAAKGHADSLGAIDPDVPAEEISSADLFAQMDAAQAAEREREAAMTRTQNARHRVDQLQAELSAARQELDAAVDAQAALGEGDPDLVARLREQRDTLDATNQAVRDNAARRAAQDAAKRLQDSVDDMTATIQELDRMRDEALAAATFPVDGLGFDADGVTFQGVPFSQASAAEQIKVSLGMAMALNPELRVIRILDGSLLDTESMDTIATMARDNDYQVWIERVEDTSSSAIVINDGTVEA